MSKTFEATNINGDNKISDTSVTMEDDISEYSVVTISKKREQFQSEREISQNLENQHVLDRQISEHGCVKNETVGTASMAVSADRNPQRNVEHIIGLAESQYGSSLSSSSTKSPSSFSLKGKASFFHRHICISLTLISALVSAIISSAVVILYIKCIYEATMEGDQLVIHEAPKAQTGELLSSSSSIYGQFNLNLKILRDEKRFLWESDREQSIRADPNGCVTVYQSEVYVVYSKITFEYWKHSNIEQLFHVIIMNSKKNDGDREVLVKNVFSLPKKEFRQIRTFQPSNIQLIQKLEAGDSLCVNVTDTAWIYPSPTDNTFNIFNI